MRDDNAQPLRQHVGLSPLAATELPDKPNWVEQAGNTLCVADTGTVVRIYPVPQ